MLIAPKKITMEQSSILNNFKTLMLLCANMEERQRLLKDFIVAHHPDRFTGELAEYYTQLIFKATDIFNQTPLIFGAGRPKNKVKAKASTNYSNLKPELYAFIGRLEVYTWYHRAVTYQHNILYKEKALFNAMLACNAFFDRCKGSCYLNEVTTLREQILELAS